MIRQKGFLFRVFLLLMCFFFYPGLGIITGAENNNSWISQSAQELEQEIIELRKRQLLVGEGLLQKDAPVDRRKQLKEPDLDLPVTAMPDVAPSQVLDLERSVRPAPRVPSKPETPAPVKASAPASAPATTPTPIPSRFSAPVAEPVPVRVSTPVPTTPAPAPRPTSTSVQAPISPSMVIPALRVRPEDPKFDDCLTCDIQEKPKVVRMARLKTESDRIYHASVSDKRMTIDFKETPLDKVFRVFSEWAEVNIVLDPELKDVLATIYLKDVTLREAMDIVMSSYGLKQAEIGDSIFVASTTKINSMDSVTRIIKLRNVKARNIEKLLTDLVGFLASDEESNSIVINGTPYQIEQALKIVEEVDRPQRQVLLTAQILEVSHSFGKQTGIDWNTSTVINLQETNRPSVLPGTVSSAATPFRILRLARNAADFQITIQHMLENGQARLLANPRIAAVTGKEASIFIGDKIPYEVSLASGGSTMTEVRFAEAGIKLSLTPSIIEDDYVVVTVAPEVSNISEWRGAQNQYPQISTRQAEASMRVQDGETFILGGLLSEEDTVTIKKVPFFSDLPLFGNLFKSEKKETRKKEIIITVTPQIISR